MKTWKLVSGILSMILFVLVAVQSCAAGVVNALEDNGGTSGSIGMLVGVLMLAGGIVSVATRKSQGKGGNIDQPLVKEGVKNFVSLEVHASLDKSSICRNLLSVLGIFCCRIFLLILV